MSTGKLYVNGCSWTAGNGIQHDPSFNVSDPMDAWQFTKTLNWGKVLGELLQLDCINEADGGGSNARMVRTTCRFINRIPKDQYKDTIVVLGWTTPDRNEIYIEENNRGQWCKYNSNQKFSDYLTPFSPDLISNINILQKLHITYSYNHMTNYTHFFQEMFLMSNMLENLGIRYLFFHALPWESHINSISIRHFFKREMENLRKPTILDSREPLNVMSLFCDINKCPMAIDHHTMIEGHKLWAEHLYKKLK